MHPQEQYSARLLFIITLRLSPEKSFYLHNAFNSTHLK